MARADNLMVEILKEIRDEIRQTNVRLDETRTELSDRLDHVSSEMGQLHRRQTETEVRLATELVAVVGAVHELRDAILDDRRVRHAVDDHEARIRVLERRVG